MKNAAATILISILIISVFVGCREKNERIIGDLVTILEQPVSEENISEADAYLDEYLPKVKEELADDMVMRFEDYLLSNTQDGINYTEWISQYEGYITPLLVEVYRLKEKEQQNPMVVDTVLKISWEELLQRTHDLETFIDEHKEDQEIRADLNWLYSNYMIALVMGTNGTPIFDYKSQLFSESAKTTYAEYIEQYPDTTTAWALNEYFTYLESINFKLDYNDKELSKLFFDTCDWLVSESGKRVFQVDE